jgi:mono/diheme cytochrome c family protein
MARVVTMLLLGTVAIALVAVAIAQPLFSATQDPIAGSRVFGAKGCVKCHSVNGTGGKIGPDLAKIARPHTFYDLGATLWNHASVMARWMRQLGIARPQLDAREMGDLVAFLYTLDYFDPPGHVDVGRRLFSEKRCIMCHQVGGTGGVIGPSLDAGRHYESPIALAAAMWNHGPQMAERMKARGVERPTFKDGELRDLIAYVTSSSTSVNDTPVVVLPGRAAEGRRLFVEKGCASCHDGRFAPDLSERAANKSLSEFATAMWNKAPTMTDAMRRRGIAIPQLTAPELADIVAYLYSVRYFARAGDPRNGVKVATEKGCLDCHALRGERGKRAGDLARAAGTETPAGVMSALWNHSFIGAGDQARAPWPTLTSSEVADLSAFLASLKMRAR